MTIDEIFKIAVSKQASDVHLIVGLPPYLRLAGELQPLTGQAKLTAKLATELIFSLLSTRQKEVFLNTKELDLSYQLKSGQRFRINLHQEKNNFGLAARVIPAQVPSLEDIAMPEVIYDWLQLNQGLILVTGPTGCGKSTSLAAMVEHINISQSKSIVTLEDPIEFLFEPKKSIIRQRQLNTDMITFQSALIHTLRQDPDVIMVGEMRDLETIAAAVTIAETGHLVLATLHTNNTVQTIDRIIDVFPPQQQQQIRLQVSLTLKGIISQELIPNKTGGQIALREILINTPAVANLIRENKTAQIKTVLQTSAEQGMVTMKQSLADLCQRGLVDDKVAEVYLAKADLMK